MLNYESTKAMFESFRVRWPHNTGNVQWMLNSARPSIYWQLNDNYLQPNAAYYGVKKANAPVQLIYDYYTKAVYAVNESMEPVSFKASMKLLKGEQATDKSMIRPPLTPPTLGEKELLQMLPGAVVKVFDVDTKDAAAAFLLLKLTDEKGAEIAGNEYFIVAEKDTYDWAKTNWVHTPIIKYGSYAMLDNLCTKSCELSVKPMSEGLYEATVSNPSDKVAFMVRLKAKDQNGELICPAYWSDNYLTLAPGESRTATCRMPSLAADTTVNIQLSE